MNRLFTILSVTSRLFRWVPLLTVMLALAAKSPAQEKVRQPDLYYLVVDMSGSIPIYGLKQPIIDEVTRFIKSLPDQCVLKVQLFDHQILPQWKREIGPRMTDIAKEDMIQWFRRTYDPKGNTFLYDVTGGALREIEKDRDVYDSVRLIILSDGINDTGGLPSKYPDWASLVPLTKSLTKGGKTGDAVWLYLEAVKQDAKKPQPAASEVPRPLEPIKTIIVGRDDTLIIEKAIRPEVQFDAHPREVSAGNAVQFFLVKETAVKTYTWTFSDGQESKERLPRVTFKSPGKIDVKLIVEGPGGKTEQKEEAFIQVLENAPPPKPSALFIAHPTTVNPGQKVLFTVRSNIGSSSYEWNFGDGATSTEAQPLHAFDKAGSYDVTLKATGPGGSDSSVLKAAVEVQALPKPSAAFTVHPPSVFVGEEVLCTVQSTAGIESYKWNLGDGSSSTDAQPRHAYAKAGSYDVTLDVSGPGGSDRSES
ncbi:MAG: PKD domain-containing protein, partial [Armatimonadota bacterium]